MAVQYLYGRMHKRYESWSGDSGASLYADNTVLLAESNRMLQESVNKSDRVCRRKLKVNAGKSNVMFFERAIEKT